MEAQGEGTEAATLASQEEEAAAPAATAESTAADAAGTATTYRRLWEAASGHGGKHSLESLEKKITDMEAELIQLKAQQDTMKLSKQALVDGSARV